MSKYGNRKVTYQGMTFDSQLEFKRYLFLVDQERQGKIYGLARQVPFALLVDGTPICKMILDFCYHLPDGRQITEDAKGRITPDWNIKRKMFEAQYRSKINIVTKNELTTLLVTVH